ncbi:MAG: DapH/DapD/GlmU-related protein, partial [Nanoarchaeota archaeon]
VRPGAVICGNVEIGDEVFIGANATILPGIKICSNVMIGAGSVVTKNIEHFGVYAGNPCRSLNKSGVCLD